MKYKFRKKIVSAILAGIFAIIYMLPTRAAGQSEYIPAGGSLTIHKYALMDMELIGAPGTGEQQEVPISGILLAGITFSLWEVDIRDGIPATAEEAGDYLIENTKQSAMTDQEGRAYFELKSGIYYVEEADATDSAGSSYVPCDPFLVSVPMRAPSGNGWITDIHVYPKNQIIAIDEFVNGPGASYPDFSGIKTAKSHPVAAGEPFGLTIAATIPYGIGEAEVEKYIISSVLPDGVTFIPDSVQMYLRPGGGGLSTERYLLNNKEHYTASYHVGEKKVTAELTETGRKTVARRYSQYHETTIVMKYDCILEEDAPQGIDLYADAELVYIKKLGDGMVVLTASVQEQPAIHTGQMEIVKLDAENREQGLAGARFGLSLSKEEALRQRFVAEGTTDQDGRLILKGLKYGKDGDYSNQNSTGNNYWLTEIEAPEAYVGLKEPIELEFSHQLDNEDGSYYFARVNVYNISKHTQTGPPGAAAGSSGSQTSDTTDLLLRSIGMIVSLIFLIVMTADKKGAKNETDSE